MKFGPRGGTSSRQTHSCILLQVVAAAGQLTLMPRVLDHVPGLPSESFARTRQNRLARGNDFLPGLHPCLQLVAQTRDLALAQQWLALVPALEGVVAKKSDGHYAPGRRDWVKVKRHRTVECVVIGLVLLRVTDTVVPDP